MPSRKKRENELGLAPFCITEEEIKLADQRACSIVCPTHIDFFSRVFFQRPFRVPLLETGIIMQYTEHSLDVTDSTAMGCVQWLVIGLAYTSAARGS